MSCGVVVVAAGQGKRLENVLHKALVEVGGRPLFLHCVEKFSLFSGIDEVVVVIHKDDLPTFREGKIGEKLAELGVTKIVEGGAERQDSVLAGLLAMDKKLDIALIHDAARPFVSSQTIGDLVAALDIYEAAVPVVPVSSTVKQLDEKRQVVATIPRGSLGLAQTPQAAKRELLIAALSDARKRGKEVTDDVQAMELAGHSVIAVADSRWNFKVTTPEDLVLANLVVREGLHLEE